MPTQFMLNDIFIYIFSWKHVTTNAMNLYNAITAVVKTNVIFINCDENTKIPSSMRGIQLDDSYYYGGQYQTALRETPLGKIVCCITGDVSPNADWSAICNNCIAVMNRDNAGIYAPNVEITYYTNKVQQETKYRDALYDVPNTDCTCWFIHPNVVEPLRWIPYKDIVNLGWGTDTITIMEARRQQMRVLRDYSVLVIQPPGTNYSHSKAKTQQYAIEHYYKLLRSITIEPTQKCITIGSEGMGRWACKMMEYILRLAYPDCIIKWENTPNCDIIIRSHFLNQEPEIKTSKRIPYIYWSGETWDMSMKDYLPLATLQTTTLNATKYHNFIYFPLIVLYFDYQKYQRLGLLREYTPQHKRPYFVAYCNSAFVSEREQLFALLKERDTTSSSHGLGGCSTTIGKRIPKDMSNEGLVKVLSQYRFVFAMENKCASGYITEKILHAFAAGAVPIYWGDSSEIKKMFNSKAFICVNDFKSLADCADYIISIDRDSAKYNSMISEPVFYEDVLPDIFRLGDYDNPANVYRTISSLLTIR